jgi:hypothetical protein
VLSYNVQKQSIHAVTALPLQYPVPVLLMWKEHLQGSAERHRGQLPMSLFLTIIANKGLPELHTAAQPWRDYRSGASRSALVGCMQKCDRRCCINTESFKLAYACWIASDPRHEHIVNARITWTTGPALKRTRSGIAAAAPSCRTVCAQGSTSSQQRRADAVLDRRTLLSAGALYGECCRSLGSSHNQGAHVGSRPVHDLADCKHLCSRDSCRGTGASIRRRRRLHQGAQWPGVEGHPGGHRPFASLRRPDQVTSGQRLVAYTTAERNGYRVIALLCDL